VIGVSPDTAKKHAKFKMKYGLTYTLVADTDHAICERYGVWARKSMFGRAYWGVARTTFVIDAEGRVAARFEKVNPLGHAAAVADVVARLS
jgi:peroxiredoxin Q/BCP